MFDLNRVKKEIALTIRLWDTRNRAIFLDSAKREKGEANGHAAAGEAQSTERKVSKRQE